MPSDRARRSYDATRMYRSVVSQQGRVTVEADANEAEEIRTAESRADLIDIIGPTGTPDDGFNISVPGKGPGDFAIGHGSIYVGGVRVVNDDVNATYQGQQRAEWADFPAGALWAYPASKTPFTELVYLTVTEQEISAVEDPALREVALGGPDTAGRTRLIQRVHRAPTDLTDCEAALDQVLKKTSPDLQLDPKTMRLVSTSRLKVDFVPVPGAGDQCQPTSQAGFLGAENQLIRVQVTSDRQLLWGYDNASFVYRVAVDRASPTRLRLQSMPVDVFHRPRAAQWVEVLTTAVTLGGDAYVANAVGMTGEVDSYEPTENVITLKAEPQGLVNLLASSHPPAQVFVRIWENQLRFVGDGITATDLVTAGGASSTGVRVYTKGAAVPGDYWMIGVRPSMPSAIFPSRLDKFQPADGPGRWATSLATIAWSAELATASVHDCRRRFDNLVELTRQRCCELTVLRGDDAQKVIAERIRRNAKRSINTLHIRFAAGVFTLDAPLVIAAMNGGELTVSGCGTTLAAATQEVALVLDQWDSASVFDLTVDASVARPGPSTRAETVSQSGDDAFRHLGGAITFLNCRTAVVERVVARCGSGDRRAASCVTIRNADDRGGDARVRSCDLAVGTRQVGVLLVNVDRGTVDDNRIGLREGAPGTIPVDVLKRWLISSAGINRTPAEETLSTLPRRTVNEYALSRGRVLRYVTDDTLADAWPAVFKTLRGRLVAPPGRSRRRAGAKRARTDQRRIQRVIASVLTQIFQPKKTSPLDAAVLEPFRGWLDEVTRGELLVAASGQGIVVGGVRARDIRILHNSIVDAMDGIHIGLSTRGARDVRVLAGRVQVIGNTISARVPWFERAAHAGIFVGNVDAATVRDNRVDIQLLRTQGGGKPGPMTHMSDDTQYAQLTRRADAIRVWGTLGPMLLVTGNSTHHAQVGIKVVASAGWEADPLLLVTQNLAVDAAVAIDATANVTVAPDNVPAP